MSSSRNLYRKLTDLTDQEKSDIIRTVKSGELFLEQVQDAFNISKCTANRIMQTEKEKESQIKKRQPGRPRRRRCGNNKPIDDALSKWYHSMKDKKFFVNGPLLRQQAVKFARMMNNHTFEASNGWLWRWQQKEKVRLSSPYQCRKQTKTPEPELASSGDLWQTLADDKTEHSEDVSVRSFDESNNSASCWQNLTAPAALPHEQVEVIVKQELDLPLDCEIISDTENDDGRSSGFHLGLSNEGQELVTKTTVPCFLCQNSEKVTPFDDDSFDKCLNSIKFRRMKNARYGDIALNNSDKYNLGFHTICFDNVVKIGQNWLTEYEKMCQDQKQSRDQDEMTGNDESFSSNQTVSKPIEVKQQSMELDSAEQPDRRQTPKTPKLRNVYQQDQRDIYSAYGDYIAHRLRASASERGNYEVCVAQRQIDEVIFKLSMGSYARDSIDPTNIEKTLNMD